MSRRAGAAALVLSLSVLVTACSPEEAADPSPSAPSPPPSPTPSPLETIRGRFGSRHTPRPPSPTPVVVQTPAPLPSTLTGTWLGVLATVRDPNKLDADLKKLRKRFGRSVMTGQVFCWPGVNEGRHMSDDTYFLAFITGSRPEAESLVAQSGYDAEFYARVFDRCGG